MAGIVTFDIAAWRVRYPEFAAVGDPQVQACFTEATLYLANNGYGPVPTDAQQLTLLGMLTAHVVALNFGAGGAAPSPLVGQITSASEGSVSVSVNSLAEPGSGAWYAQTKYGAAFWAATAGYRTMHYRPGPQFGPRRYF